MIDQHFTTTNVAGELDYLASETHRSFERPYGIAWLLMFAAELSRHTSAEGRRWYDALRPFATECARRLLDHIEEAEYPVRAGLHNNSAFALTLGLEYAGVRGDFAMAEALRHKFRTWLWNDSDCQAWEPDGEDFLSPALTEVLCMSRAVAPAEFSVWLSRFLPRLAERKPATLFRPARVSNPTDPKFVHLDGSNLARAWCWKNLGTLFETDDPRRAIALQSADSHLEASLHHIADDYAGRHWLATFATLALDA